jgi:hypothetical protein
MRNLQLYETDFYAWAQEQAEILRQEKFQQLDIVNIIEEIEEMGKSQQRQLASRMAVLIAHLLKWQFQVDKRSRSWQATIRTQRRHLQRLLNQNPSLSVQLEQVVTEAYEDALDAAWAETGLAFDVFPPTCPYTVAQILDGDFFP